MRNRLIGLFLGLLFSSNLWAAHIIGGEITYVCDGNGAYSFVLYLYRDCGSDGPDFEPTLSLTYYLCPDGDCGGFEQMDGRTLRRSVPEISNVDPPELACLVSPPNICVEQAIYRFSTSSNELFPPKIDSTYLVAFQICCRNETILNIADPRTTGSTYKVEITPPAQSFCNSSPTFNNFPPTIVCLNEPLNFDHSAVDSDGDSLVYSLCTPLVGGGVRGSSLSIDSPDMGAFECDGGLPSPACPPATDGYEGVRFIGQYTAENPMAGNPLVSIDPETGLITGTPNIQGQFLVGVCVEEFRNGISLGVIQRDFQFNVAECTKEVIAQIAADDVAFVTNDDGTTVRSFSSRFCDKDSVEFINQSVDRNFINTVRWEFAEGIVTTDGWDASVRFPGQGIYSGQLILNENDPSCGDSARITVEVLPTLEAGFLQSFDSCIIGPVTFVDTSFSEINGIVNWQWDFGDGENSSQQNPIHQYDNSGDYDISLLVTDENGCTDRENAAITYAPAPTTLSFAESSEGGCNPTPITFTNTSNPIGADYDLLWDFGDGNTSTETSPTHVYEVEGVYTVSLFIESPIGCEVAETFTDLITILPAPMADFSLTPDELTSTNPTVQVTDASVDASTWFYDFNGQGSSTTQNPTFTFRTTGLQPITQIVTAPSGCRDTFQQVIDVIPFVEWYMPNAFTPTRDGVNDIFIGNGNLNGATDFIFTIWNRWGELIFETTDFTEGWNGRKNNDGRDSPAGVYVYVLSYRTPRGELVQLEGFATLIR
ncbi:MAG: PKD domain-containing protein [Bacteroidota bacterium]